MAKTWWIIFFLTVLMACGAWMIQYPRTVTASIKVVTENPPVSVIARSSGRLRLFIKDQQSVRQGDRVAAAAGSANVDDVLALGEAVYSFDARAETAEQWRRFHCRAGLALGELEAVYVKFMRSVEDYVNYDRQNSLAMTKSSLESRIAQHRMLQSAAARQKEFSAKEVELADRQRSIYVKLRAEGLVAEEQWIRVEKEYLARQQALETAHSNLITNEIQLSEYQNTLAERERQDRERRVALVGSVRAAFDDLKSRLVEWEDRSILRAPAEGRVS